MARQVPPKAKRRSDYLALKQRMAEVEARLSRVGQDLLPPLDDERDDTINVTRSPLSQPLPSQIDVSLPLPSSWGPGNQLAEPFSRDQGEIHVTPSTASPGLFDPASSSAPPSTIHEPQVTTNPYWSSVDTVQPPTQTFSTLGRVTRDPEGFSLPETVGGPPILSSAHVCSLTIPPSSTIQSAADTIHAFLERLFWCASPYSLYTTTRD